MLRLSVLLAVLFPAVAVAADPPTKPKPLELPPTQFPDIVFPDIPPPPRGPKGEAPPKEAVEAYLKKVEERDARLSALQVPDPAAGDKPLVKLAKAKLAAVSEAQRKLLGAVKAGINTPQQFNTYCELGASLSAAADEAFDKPADRVGWYEHRVLLAKMMEQHYFARANVSLPGGEFGSVDSPYLLPLASVARLDAEIALLKLKEKLGK